jgi:putative transposase
MGLIMSILTYVINHSKNFSNELKTAKKLAIFAKKNKCKSTKDVKEFGLKSVISNQIIKKYVRNFK